MKVVLSRCLLIAFLIGIGSEVLAAPPAKETASGTHTQNWDRSIPSSTRFTVLAEFNNQAVRDNNTGLVWEQAPDATYRTWAGASNYCVNKDVGGTVGWRLPSVVELSSVRDPSQPAPFVSASVFTGVQLNNYWSASSNASNASNAWGVYFTTNGPTNGFVSDSIPKTGAGVTWCVRGPMQESVY